MRHWSLALAGNTTKDVTMGGTWPGLQRHMVWPEVWGLGARPLASLCYSLCDTVVSRGFCPCTRAGTVGEEDEEMGPFKDSEADSSRFRNPAHRPVSRNSHVLLGNGKTALGRSCHPPFILPPCLKSEEIRLLKGKMTQLWTQNARSSCLAVSKNPLLKTNVLT